MQIPCSGKDRVAALPAQAMMQAAG